MLEWLKCKIKHILGKEHMSFERIMNGLNLSQDHLNKQYTALFIYAV